MKSYKFLTVIIPVYNVEKYLGRCVESVIRQSINEMEIILVNDGSIDNSGIICDLMSKEHPEMVKVIHKKNGGLSSARNVGLDIAQGKYVFFLDSDDSVSDKFIGTIYESLRSEKYDIIEFGCFWERVFNNFNPIYSDRCAELTPKECIENILKNKAGNEICLKVYKKELFNSIRFPEGRNYEDIATCFRLFIKSNRILRYDSELYNYNITNADSITKKVDLKSMNDMYESVNELCEGVKSFCIENEIDLTYVEYYKRHIYIYIYIKIMSKGFVSCELKKIISEYLSNNNKYNIVKFRYYDLKRWLYYEIMHLIHKM